METLAIGTSALLTSPPVAIIGGFHVLFVVVPEFLARVFLGERGHPADAPVTGNRVAVATREDTEKPTVRPGGSQRLNIPVPPPPVKDISRSPPLAPMGGETRRGTRKKVQRPLARRSEPEFFLTPPFDLPT
jgi:hypothetical protein